MHTHTQTHFSRFDSVIVRHFAFDGVLYRRTLEATSGEFDFDEKEDKKDKDKGSRDDDDLGNADTIDDGGGGGGGGGSSDSLKRSSTSAGRGRVVVYHVTPEMPPPEVLRGISPLSVLDFRFGTGCPQKNQIHSDFALLPLFRIYLLGG